MPGLEIKARLGEADASGLTPVLGPAVIGEPTVRTDTLIGNSVQLLGYDIQPAELKSAIRCASISTGRQVSQRMLTSPVSCNC